MFPNRALLLRDGITFSLLCLVTVVLFGLTLLLFRSFEAHRAHLGDQWSARGRAALAAGKASEAVEDFRTALSFSPTDRDDQLALAQALAASGQTEEATNYFLGLWEARPGDGFLNFELARLFRTKGDKRAAVNYYRAAIFGSWEGDGVQRRRETRLELADYLASQGEADSARSEILIAAGNAPDREDLELVFGDKLRAIGDPTDALTYYRKAIQDDPLRETALEEAGRTAFSLGRYREAEELLARAIVKAKKQTDSKKLDELISLEQNSKRLVALNTSRELPADERAEHLLAASTIAWRRMQSCSVQLTNNPAGQGQGKSTPTLPPAMTALKARWTTMNKAVTRAPLEHDAMLQDTLGTLVFDTERETATVCGRPEGDDALLLMLARAPETE